MNTRKIGISLSIIGVAAVLMVVTAPTLENHQAMAATRVVREQGWQESENIPSGK